MNQMDLQEFLDFVKNKPYHSDTQSSTNPYGFLIGWKAGRTYTLGSYPSEEEANMIAMEHFDADKYIIVWSKYRDRSKLTSGIKHSELSFSSIEEATRRIKHK